MKRIFILWIGILGGLTCFSQGVEFRNLSYRQALIKAGEEGKLVFLDCYTSWCGPCKNMLNNVFPKKEAGDFFNSAFVCVKFDMEKGEGIELQKKFGIHAFPTFLMIRPDGVVQHRLVGGSKLENFIPRVKRGLNEKTSLLYLNGLYAEGKMTAKQLPVYVEVLKDASERDKIEEITNRVFSELSDREKCRKENWYLFDRTELNPLDVRFEYLVTHKTALDKTVGEETVGEKLYSVYLAALRGNNKKENKEELLQTIDRQLQFIDFDQKKEIELVLNYVKACQTQNIESVLQIWEKHLHELPESFWIDIPFRFSYIVRNGSIEQLRRYVAIGEELIETADNPQMKKIIEDTFGQYRIVLTERESFAEIKGRVTRPKLEKIGVYEVVDGSETLISSTRVGTNGWYGFAFEPPHAGFYMVGGERTQERIRIYLEPGQQAEVNILEDTLVITSWNTPENLLLASWEKRIEAVRRRVLHMDYIFYIYKDFFPYFQEFLPEAEKFKENIRTPNERFNELLKRTVDYDIDYMGLSILTAPKADPVTHRPGQPQPEDYQGMDYYKTLVNADKVRDTVLLQQPYGVDFLQKYTSFALKQEGKKLTLADQLTYLPCDLLKAEVVLDYARRSRTYEQYDNIVTKYKSCLTTASHKRRVDELCAKLYVGDKGKQAADFTYPDRNGKMVSLSDFRGKVVVVDVWATWCGPCRAEVPHLVKLEKEMKGSEVVFIGVSVDEKKDYQKWLDVLDKESMEGIQLFADGWGKIVKDYKIKGIPRFMVFDRNGKVVTIDAPRPSNPELKKLLKKLLNSSL